LINKFTHSNSQDAIACLKQFHVVKLEAAFDDHALLQDVRDAIEIADYFACSFGRIFSRKGQNKEQAFRRFSNPRLLRASPAFSLFEAPLTNLAVEKLIAQSPLLTAIWQSRFRSFEIHSSWGRPSNSGRSSRKTEWLWHQDVHFHRGDDLTVWIPLVPCGEDAPGIEFLVSDKPTVYPNAGNGWSIAGEVIGEIFQPIFRLGDCVVFDGLAVHRTYVTSRMDKERTSLDIRLTPDSSPKA
jgi:hypothetical protein